MPAKRVQKLRQKRQNLRSKRKGGGSEAKETSAGYAGRDVATTSYLRTQGKAYAQGREGRSAYKAGSAGKSTEESKADTVGGRDRRKKVLTKKIRKVSKAIKKARK